MSTPALNIVVLISGNGSNLQAIIDAILSNRLHANIRCVISNRPDVKGLERAKAANINALCIDHRQFDSREAFDHQLMLEIDKYQPDLIILAGFMRILTHEFVSHYSHRMLNIHPSLLPDFPGLNTHQRALEAGVKQHGVSIHYVTNELDGGPLILQAVIEVCADDTSHSLQQKIHQQEHIIYPMVIEWIAQQRLEVIEQRLYMDKKQLGNPLKWINSELIS
ncbi:Phosphoribosylglycinamide formyltransferase [hydrothermal vent metagenome]|uniref:phosphoribosylglycinamide formyltransferase 1 n=1 Tax=hydrothermal vent metagenome TaxID=652676 RepID=A0A3B0XFU6_9ZZZZ